MTPPSTQNRSVAPTLSVYWMMEDGVEKMPVPTTRLMIRKAVDHVPSFLSLRDQTCYYYIFTNPSIFKCNTGKGCVGWEFEVNIWGRGGGRG